MTMGGEVAFLEYFVESLVLFCRAATHTHKFRSMITHIPHSSVKLSQNLDSKSVDHSFIKPEEIGLTLLNGLLF